MDQIPKQLTSWHTMCVCHSDNFNTRLAGIDTLAKALHLALNLLCGQTYKTQKMSKFKHVKQIQTAQA